VRRKSMNLNWTSFPPTDEDAERLKMYATFRNLMRGRHIQAFDALNGLPPRKRRELYVAVNFAGVVSKACADLLFGEAPGFTVQTTQSRLDEIVTDNNLETICHMMALSSSYRGDCVFKVRFGKFHDWDDTNHPIIEAVPSSFFFPVTNDDNVMGMSAAIIAWRRKVGSDLYLRREIHEPGTIRQELFRMESENTIGDQVSLSTLSEYASLPEVQETGYPGLLIEYVPNWRLDDEFWGISDYFDIIPLQEELNNRITKTAKILDRHSDPKLILPPGVMKYDEKLQRWYVEKEDLEALEVDPEQVGDLPKYLTWDAQLTACFEEIDRMLDYLMLVTETAPAAIGLTSKDGGQAESGKALRFRLMRTLGKINRKKRFFDEALKKSLFAAQALRYEFGGGPAPEAVSIEWKDGLPDDPSETAEVLNSRKNMGTMSLRRALTIDGLRGEALEEEISEIQKDRELDSVLAPEVNPDGEGEEETVED